MTTISQDGSFKSARPSKPNLWHVFQPDKLKSIRSGLWFSRLDLFGDKLENTLPMPNKCIIAKMPDGAKKFINKTVERSVYQNYALCFHHSDKAPSRHIWSTFGQRQGIAFLTNYDRLKDATKQFWGENGPLYLHDVMYIDHATDSVDMYNVINIAFAIRKGFQKEEETRFLIHTAGSDAKSKLAGIVESQSLLVL